MPPLEEKPKYHQLADHLRERIQSGALKVGARLPSYTELYDELGVSTATIQRACDVLDQENLIERRQGSGVYVAAPRRAQTGNIGVIGSAGFQSQDSPFYARLMNAVHQAASLAEQHVLYLGPETLWDAGAEEKVDGVLICGVEENVSMLDQLPPELPRISVFTSLAGMASVGVDEYRGAQMAVRHLLDLGHRRIACLMEREAWQARRRFAGYCDALMESGIPTTSQWQRVVGAVGHRNAAQPYLNWSHKHMSEWLLDGWRETGCTAIMAQNDVAAIGIMQVLQKEGIRVPQDVSVIGFDGTEICDLVSPSLASIVVPLAQIGARAVELLNRQIAGEDNSSETILLPLQLRHGKSVAKLRADL
jgi:DNA-binding LacI/PurR family transcriptional regulator